MASENPLRIAIIGAGASGTLLTIQLCRQAGSKAVQIFLVEKAARMGPGLAYATPDPLHLLNVPAGRISAFSDQPDHFVSWLQQQNLAFAASDFVPRYVYGNYLASLLQEATKNLPANVQVKQIAQEAINITPENNRQTIFLADGSSLIADKVVLAFGNFPPGSPCGLLDLLPANQFYTADPWQPQILENIPSTNSVLLIGTGLTMADVLLSLHKRNHQGPVMAVSTHGLLPEMHKPCQPFLFTEDVAQLKTVYDWFVCMRRQMAVATAQGNSWQAVIDAFRPFTQQFWLGLPFPEKKKFLQHLRHLWSVTRHRLPPFSATVLSRLLQNGQLTIHKGRVTKTQMVDNGIVANITHAKKEHTFFANHIINCTGPQSDYLKIQTPLVQSLLQQEIITPDVLSLGLSATPDGRVLNKNNQLSNTFFTLGPPLKGVLWESTAIKEIREQAQSLATMLLN